MPEGPVVTAFDLLPWPARTGRFRAWCVDSARPEPRGRACVPVWRHGGAGAGMSVAADHGGTGRAGWGLRVWGALAGIAALLALQLSILGRVYARGGGATLAEVLTVTLAGYLLVGLTALLRRRRGRGPEKAEAVASDLLARIAGEEGAATQCNIDELRDAWGLTRGEAEVAVFAAKGFSNREIGTFRGASVATVKKQMSSVYRKSGLENRYQLIAHMQNEALDPEEGRPGTETAHEAARQPA